MSDIKQQWHVRVEYTVEAEDPLSAAVEAWRRQHDDKGGFDTTYTVDQCLDPSHLGSPETNDTDYGIRIWVPIERDRMVAGIVISPDENFMPPPFIKE